jgi:hypothetical protein
MPRGDRVVWQDPSRPDDAVADPVERRRSPCGAVLSPFARPYPYSDSAGHGQAWARIYAVAAVLLARQLGAASTILVGWVSLSAAGGRILLDRALLTRDLYSAWRTKRRTISVTAP